MDKRTGAAPTATAREWWGLAVLALPTLLLSIDITVLHLGVPHISAALEPSSAQLLWIVDVYGFMIAAFLVTMGVLGDRVGRRRLLLVGAAAFGAASTMAAFAPSAEVLVLARALMGVAGATLMPSTLALISNMFPDARQRGTAIAVWATMFSVGIALGPVVGGLLLDRFWWGSVFLLGVPVMVVLLVLGPFLLPEHRDPASGRIDLLSVGLVMVAMLAVTYGVKEVATHGPSWSALAVGTAGLLLGTAFVRRQARLPEPLLDLALLGEPRVRAALTVLFVSVTAVAGIYLFVTQHLQLVEGRSPVQSGLLLLPAAAALIACAMVSPTWSRRWGPGAVIGAGMSVMTVGFVALTFVESSSSAALVVGAFVLVYAGVGATTALGTDLVVGSAPPAKAGAASAIGETSTELGAAVGVAVMGSAGAAVYRAGMDDAEQGAAAQGTAEGADQTLAGALDAAGGTGPAGADLVASATAAFADGFVAAAWIGVALGLVATVTALRVLRGDVTATEPATEPAGAAGV